MRQQPTDLQAFADAVTKHIRPDTFPVAVRMLKEGEALPPRTKRPRQDMGIQVAICQAVAMARHQGWVVSVSGEDLSCPLAQVVFGFRPSVDYYENGHACAGMYTETAEAGAATEAAVAKFAFGVYSSVLIAPIHRTAFDPHVIIIYGNSAQVMRLLTAALWNTGGRLTSSFSGRLDCSDSIIVPVRSQEPQVILPCYGDRIFAQTQDHEMAFAMPTSWIPTIIEGLEGTHKGGIRYPIPQYLRYTGQFPPSYEKLREYWG
jgi:uncharacterized protein (DUF169 family)